MDSTLVSTPLEQEAVRLHELYEVLQRTGFLRNEALTLTTAAMAMMTGQPVHLSLYTHANSESERLCVATVQRLQQALRRRDTATMVTLLSPAPIVHIVGGPLDGDYQGTQEVVDLFAALCYHLDTESMEYDGVMWDGVEHVSLMHATSAEDGHALQCVRRVTFDDRGRIATISLYAVPEERYELLRSLSALGTMLPEACRSSGCDCVGSSH